MTVRPELLYFAQDDGGIDVLDLVYERIHRFRDDEAEALRAFREGGQLTEALRARLDEASLLEDEEVEALRWRVLWSRKKQRPERVDFEPPEGAAIWDRARDLPETVAATWRDPERWRRLAEDWKVGRYPLRLDGFYTPEAARDLLERIEALDYSRLEVDISHGDWAQPGVAARDVYELVLGEPLKPLIAAVLRRELADRFHLNAWRMSPGDHLKPHPDGPLYVATFSIGLCEGWTAAHGGATAFGPPTADGLEARDRWVPHLGDVMIFVPDPVNTWHVVEPVEQGQRYSVTGWFIDPPAQIGLSLADLAEDGP